MSSVLEQLQADVYGRLLDDGDLAEVPIILARPRAEGEAIQIQTEIDQALAGLTERDGASKVGAAIIVQMPSGEVPEANIPGPRLEVVANLVVIENPMVNMGSSGTQISAEELGLRVLNNLHQWFIQGLGSTLVADRNAIEPGVDDQGRITQTLRLRIPIGLAKPTKVQLPVIGGTASAVTITCGTPSATILYTTDGSYPGTENSAATAYAGAFAVDTGTTVRAVALLSGSKPSDIAAKTL